MDKLVNKITNTRISSNGKLLNQSVGDPLEEAVDEQDD